ncbi:MAG TPA: hypothetical protein DD415_06330 [Clostridiales bacterium]|nr:hypothetical protein [Clostridiales bacterium]
MFMTSFTKKLFTVFLASLAAICVAFGLFFTVPASFDTAFAEGETENTPVALTEVTDFAVTNNKITGLSESALEKIAGKQFTITVPVVDGITVIASSPDGSILGEHVANLTAVTVGANITEIGKNAFFGCKLLKELNLSGATALTTVGTDAFNTNGTSNSVKTLTIPEKVTSIGDRAFANHTGLTTINFYAEACGKVAQEANNPFYTVGGNSGVTVNLGAEGKTVTKIPENLFNSNATARIKEVKFVNVDTTATTDGKVRFGANAFRTSQELTTVIFENAVIPEIGNSAFSSTKISSIRLPESVKKIGDSAFSGCDALQSIGSLDGITYIGASAFRGCSQLKSAGITSNSSLTYIGDNAFASSGLDEIIVPKGVTYLGSSAYYNCTAAAVICYYAEELGTVSWIESPFRGVGTMTSGTSLILGGNNMPIKMLSSFTFQSKDNTPINIVQINFANVQIEATEHSPLFGNNVFERLTALKTVVFDSACNIGIIGSYAFSGCTSLGEVELPTSVKTIENSAFNGCTSLHSINTNDVTYIDENAFKGCVSLYSVNLSSVTDKANIKNNAFAGCTRLLEAVSTLSFTPDELTAKGLSGAKIVASSEITAVGNFIFSNAAKTDLISYVGDDEVITLPEGNYSIHERAFSGNTKITQVNFGRAQVTGIGAYAFSSCTSLRKIEITKPEENFTGIGMHAFDGCTSLETVTFGEGLSFSYIDEFTFYNCVSLKSISIPASVTEIKERAFSGCHALESVTFNEAERYNGTETIKEYKLTTIGANSFDGCASLKYIEIPESVTTIGTYAFDGCTSLATVYLPASLETCNANAFRHTVGNIILIAADAESYNTYSNTWANDLRTRLTFIVEVELYYGNKQTAEITEKLFGMDYSYERNDDGSWSITGRMPNQPNYETTKWYINVECTTSFNSDELQNRLNTYNFNKPEENTVIKMYAVTVDEPTVDVKNMTYTGNLFGFEEVLTIADSDKFDWEITQYTLVNGIPADIPTDGDGVNKEKVIRDAGTYTISINLKEQFGKWSSPLSVPVSISAAPITPTIALKWTLEGGSALADGTLYIDGNTPYLEEKQGAEQKRVMQSYVTYSGKDNAIVLALDTEGRFTVGTNYKTTREGTDVTTMKDAAVYITSVTITMSNNYMFMVSGNEQTILYGLEYRQTSYDTYEISKTWYVAISAGNTLQGEGNANFAINGWRYNETTGIPQAPTLSAEGSDPAKLITFSLRMYVNEYGIAYDERINLQKLDYDKFGSVINAAMPAGSYELTIFVADYKKENGDIIAAGNGEHGTVYKFTVAAADPLKRLEEIDKDAGVPHEGGSIYGTLPNNGTAWELPYTGEPCFVNAKENVRVLRLTPEEAHPHRQTANNTFNIWKDKSYDSFYTAFAITYNVVNRTNGTGINDTTFRPEGDFKSANGQFVAPVEPGRYTVYFNISAPGYMIGSVNRTVSYDLIIKNSISVPVIKAVTYTGESVRFDVPNSPFYKVIYLNGNDPDRGLALSYNNNISDDYINAGAHTLMLMINEAYADYCDWDSANACGTTSKKFVKVTVTVSPAENISTQPLFMNSWTWGKYNSVTNKPSWSTKFGNNYTFVLRSMDDATKTYTYNSGIKGTDFADADAGKYELIATAAAGAGWNAFEQKIEVTIQKAEIGWNSEKIPYIQSWYYGDFATRYKTPEYALEEEFAFLAEGMVLKVSRVDGTGAVYDSVFALADANGGEVPAGNYVLRFEIDGTDNFDKWSYPVFFDVLKAQNYWDITPNVPSWVYGDYASDEREITATAIPHFGAKENVVLTYYLVDEKDNLNSQPYHSLDEIVDPLTGEINVGKYVLIATMTGTANYSDMHETRIPFEVSSAQNSWIEIPTIIGWSEGRYAGGSNYPSSKPQFGAVVYTIIDADGNEYDISKLGTLGVGSYTIKAYVAGNENFNEMTAYATFAVFEDSVGMTGLIVATAIFAAIAVGLAVGGIILLLRRNKKIEQEFRKMVKSELKRR